MRLTLLLCLCLRAASEVPPPSLSLFLLATSLVSVSARTALCITGAARTFAFPALHEAVRSALVTNETDVFAYVFSKTPPLIHGNDVLCSGPTPLELLLAKFRPIEAHIYPDPRCPPGHPDCESCVTAKNVVLQLGWIDHCFRRAREHAVAHGFEYDVYIRTRPDMFVGSPFPAVMRTDAAYTGRKTDAPGSDQLFSFRKEMYTAWWQRLCFSCSCLEHLGPCCLEYEIFKGQNVVQVRELNAMLVRDPDRTDCWDPPPRCGNEQQRAELVQALLKDNSTVCINQS
jgi:hypothetical protein